MAKYHGTRKNEGQSTIEYIIVVAVVISALLLIMGSKKSMFRSGLNKVYNMGINAMVNMAERVFE